MTNLQICFSQDGTFHYAKIHVKSKQGIQNFSRDEATKTAGENPDYMIQDMFEAIERGDYPVWDVYVQLMTPEAAEKYEWNIFDMTKVWSHKDFPLQQIGRLTMNRNVSLLSSAMAIFTAIWDDFLTCYSHETILRILNKLHFLHRIWFQDSLLPQIQVGIPRYCRSFRLRCKSS